MGRAAVSVMRFLAMLLVIVASLLIVNDIVRYPLTSDLHAFLWGAEQMSQGQTPYGPIPGSQLKYLYAPWLGIALIPATWLPSGVFAVIWHTILAICAGVSIWPLLRARRLEATLAAVLLGTFLLHAVWIGHFHPIMVALLVRGVPTRWGPVAIGVAASLKVTPIILCVRYAARREWRSLGVSLAVAAALWAPALLFDLSEYGIAVMQSHSLLGHSIVAWTFVALMAFVAAWRLAPTRYGWLSAAALWLAVLPRMILYDISGLAIASAGLHEKEAKPGVSAPSQ